MDIHNLETNKENGKPKHGQNYPPERTVVNEEKETPDYTPNPGLSGKGHRTQEAREKARFEARKAKEKVKHQGREKAMGFIHEGKERTARGLENTAGAFQRMGDQFHEQNQESLGQYADTISRQIGGVSDYLHERTPDEIMSDVQAAAHRRPWAVVAGAFILGMVTSRFLKASK